MSIRKSRGQLDLSWVVPRHKSMWTLCFSLVVATNAWAQTDYLKKIKSSGLPMERFGLHAVLLKDGQQSNLISHRSDVKMIPASVTKLATGAAFIKGFPPGTKFKTALWTDGQIQGATLSGNLCVKGVGDPSFVSENLWFLVNHFLRNEVRKVSGDLIVDDSVFDDLRFDPSRRPERVDRAYDSPVGGLSFNWNTVNVFVRPTSPGSPAKAFADPENDYIVLENKAQTVKGVVNTLVVERLNQKDGRNKIRVSGKIGSSVPEIISYKSISEPDLWFGYNLKSFLAQRNVTVSGQIKRGKCNEAGRMLAESEARNSEVILADMNKFSNNFVAEMITKQMGLELARPGTIANGMKVIRKSLLDLGLAENEFHLINPSGLTDDNLMTAQSIVLLLTKMQKDFRVFPEFLFSLPISGTDGTLKRRFKGTPAERWVRAKTGLLNKAVALAGYAGRPDGGLVAFAFMFNGQGDDAKLRSLFDETVIALLQ